MIRYIQQLVGSRSFQHAIIAVIILAGILSGLETSAALRHAHGAWFRLLDVAITGVFLAEVALKMMAHGRRPWRYFGDGWNVFDFTVVVLCLVPAGGSYVAVLRAARVLRLLRLVSALPRLQLLVGALLKSVSSMGYVGLLLALLFYIYGVAGVHLFAGAPTEHFASLGAALFTLFRVVTLDNWADLFAAQSAHVPAYKVATYFVTFIVLGTMIILNLVIGIIINSMGEMHEEIAGQERARRSAGAAGTGLADEIAGLERETRRILERLAALRSRCCREPEPTNHGLGATRDS